MRDKKRTRAVLTGAAWLVTGGLLGASLTLTLQPDTGATPEPPAEVLPPRTRPLPERVVEYSPEVDAWHQDVRFAIGNILTLSGPITDTLDDFPFQTICQQIESSLGVLAAAEPPPAEPLATYFSDWVEALGETSSTCSAATGTLTENSIAALIQRPAFEMDIFLRELDRLIDLTRGPDDPPPGS